jgi:hypothetical protein
VAPWTISVIASWESDFDVLDTSAKEMHLIIQNSDPITKSSQSYVQTASRFAALESECFATEVMYSVLPTVNISISNFPSAKAIDLRDDLQLFYKRSVHHVFAALNGFTSRVCLQRYGVGSGLDARSLIVDMFRL